ncbi:ABC transporter permease [Paractinoplanes lichenicola]|uniref:ABC transporter permease n=1 Tax=Paractinoplanes lichenicola TaxID=2802976 RepID=A0ABS1VUY0_9ACTN|nr:FtsX-like permease family protein [Actinoplanes lichenicola]MBL7258273.1 ABC transporter permease [Actinoplanes lichenicola]
MSGMLRLTLRTARANLTRSLLSSLAVVLGVAFVAGSLMFTDGLEKAMTGHVAEQYRNIDVEVTSMTQSSDASANDLAARVRKIDGVRAAEPTWTLFYTGLATADGRKIAGEHRSRTVPADPALRSVEAREGRLPEKSGEVVLDRETALREGLEIGDKLLISNVGGDPRTYGLVGLTIAEGPGATIFMTTADIAAMAGYPADTVIVDAAEGVTNEDLAARISAATGVEAYGHDELVRRAEDAAVGDAETFRNGLLAFGVIAVCMAAFVIANTFTIVLAQRTREIALLRLVGARRGQVFRSVVAEAAVIGLGGSALGLAVGVLLAYGLPTVMSSFGVTDVSPLITTRTLLVALAVGVGVTVLAALLPARRGTAVPPVAALSDAAVQVARPTGRVRRVAGPALLAIGGVVLAGSSGTGRIEVVALGAVLAVTGFLLLSPIAVPFLVRVLGRPLALLGGATVSLALANAVRNPRRIAATTNALVVGVTLIGTFTLIAKSAEAPAERRAAEKMSAQFLITDSAGLGILPGNVFAALAREPQLAPARPDYRTFDQATGWEVHTGTSTAVTADVGVPVGGTITLRGKKYEVESIAPGSLTVWLTPEDITTAFPDPTLTELQVDPAPGVSTTDARTALDRALAATPTAVAYDKEQYAKSLNANLNQGLGAVTALLALAVIIALVGVANTLTLSVVERTRENSLLRAVGLTRRQLRLTLSAEALVLALTGTLIGIALSSAIALAALRSIEMHGRSLALVMPWDRLAVLLVVAAAAALAASVLPARRAVRHPIAANLAAE